MIIHSVSILLIAAAILFNTIAIGSMQKKIIETEKKLNDMRSRLQKLMEG